LGLRIQQLRAGIPPTLRYVGLPDFPARSARSAVEHGFPMVHAVQLANVYWRVVHGADGSVTDVYQWPHKGEGAAREWLEWLGCEDAVRKGDLSQFPY
jgi:hypothetical protein